MNIEKIEAAIVRIKELEKSRDATIAEQRKITERLNEIVNEIEKAKKTIMTEMKGILSEADLTAGKKPRKNKTTGVIFDVILNDAFKNEIERDLKDILKAVKDAGYKESSLPVALNKLVKSGRLSRIKRGVYRIEGQQL